MCNEGKWTEEEEEEIRSMLRRGRGGRRKRREEQRGINSRELLETEREGISVAAEGRMRGREEREG